MIKKLFLFVGALVIAAIGIFLILDFTKRYDVNFTYDYTVPNPPKLLVYSIGEEDHDNDPDKFADQKPVITVSESSTQKLPPGSYIGIINDPSYEKQELEFKVNGNTEVIIPINVSEERLASILEQNRAEILASINSGTAIPPEYLIGPGRLVKNGDWYITTIVKDTSQSTNRASFEDVYRIISQKQNGKWVLVTKKPELLLNTKANPGVPKDVIDQANDL